MAKFKSTLAALLIVPLLCLTTACTQNGSTSTISTFQINADIAASAFAAQAIVNIPAVSEHLSDADKAQITAIMAQIKSVSSEVAANSNGSVSIDTGKKWVNSLIPELQSLLAIATPIVAQYDASAAGYMTTVQQLIPLLEALIGTTVSARSGDYDATVRSRIYAGV